MKTHFLLCHAIRALTTHVHSQHRFVYQEAPQGPTPAEQLAASAQEGAKKAQEAQEAAAKKAEAAEPSTASKLAELWHNVVGSDEAETAPAEVPSENSPEEIAKRERIIDEYLKVCVETGVITQQQLNEGLPNWHAKVATLDGAKVYFDQVKARTTQRSPEYQAKFNELILPKIDAYLASLNKEEAYTPRTMYGGQILKWGIPMFSGEKEKDEDMTASQIETAIEEARFKSAEALVKEIYDFHVQNKLMTDYDRGQNYPLSLGRVSTLDGSKGYFNDIKASVKNMAPDVQQKFNATLLSKVDAYLQGLEPAPVADERGPATPEASAVPAPSAEPVAAAEAVTEKAEEVMTGPKLVKKIFDFYLAQGLMTSEQYGLLGSYMQKASTREGATTYVNDIVNDMNKRAPYLRAAFAKEVSPAILLYANSLPKNAPAEAAPEVDERGTATTDAPAVASAAPTEGYGPSVENAPKTPEQRMIQWYLSNIAEHWNDEDHNIGQELADYSKTMADILADGPDTVKSFFEIYKKRAEETGQSNANYKAHYEKVYKPTIDAYLAGKPLPEPAPAEDERGTATTDAPAVASAAPTEGYGPSVENAPKTPEQRMAQAIVLFNAKYLPATFNGDVALRAARAAQDLSPADYKKSLEDMARGANALPPDIKQKYDAELKPLIDAYLAEKPLPEVDERGTATTEVVAETPEQKIVDLIVDFAISNGLAVNNLAAYKKSMQKLLKYPPAKFKDYLVNDVVDAIDELTQNRPELREKFFTEVSPAIEAYLAEHAASDAVKEKAKEAGFNAIKSGLTKLVARIGGLLDGNTEAQGVYGIMVRDMGMTKDPNVLIKTVESGLLNIKASAENQTDNALSGALIEEVDAALRVLKDNDAENILTALRNAGINISENEGGKKAPEKPKRKIDTSRALEGFLKKPGAPNPEELATALGIDSIRDDKGNVDIKKVDRAVRALQKEVREFDANKTGDPELKKEFQKLQKSGALRDGAIGSRTWRAYQIMNTPGAGTSSRTPRATLEYGARSEGLKPSDFRDFYGVGVPNPEFEARQKAEKTPPAPETAKETPERKIVEDIISFSKSINMIKDDQIPEFRASMKKELEDPAAMKNYLSTQFTKSVAALPAADQEKYRKALKPRIDAYLKN